jgi:thiol-disulfide isomerase/thioredoxin
MQPAQTQNPTQAGPDCRPPVTLPTAPLAAGQSAPDFALRTTPDQRVALSAFIGRPVVLVFYPADWSPVCGDQLALYNELRDEWQKHRAQLLGRIAWSHLAPVGINPGADGILEALDALDAVMERVHA